MFFLDYRQESDVACDQEQKDARADQTSLYRMAHPVRFAVSDYKETRAKNSYCGCDNHRSIRERALRNVWKSDFNHVSTLDEFFLKPLDRPDSALERPYNGPIVEQEFPQREFQL